MRSKVTWRGYARFFKKKLYFYKQTDRSVSVSLQYITHEPQLTAFIGLKPEAMVPDFQWFNLIERNIFRPNHGALWIDAKGKYFVQGTRNKNTKTQKSVFLPVVYFTKHFQIQKQIKQNCSPSSQFPLSFFKIVNLTASGALLSLLRSWWRQTSSSSSSSSFGKR